MTHSSLHERLPILSGVLALALLLQACNFPSGQPTGDVLATSAAETVAALLTQPAPITLPPPLATDTPIPPTDTPTPAPPTATAPGPSPTVGTAGCTDKATFISDVTIPDDTNIPAGDSFVKTWRLQNSGTCTWNTGYALAFQSGNNLAGPASVPFTGQIAPGSTVDLSVTLTAPSAAGTYKGNWILRNDSGVHFGIGASANVAFWVQIVVGGTATPEVHAAKHIQIEQASLADLDEGIVSPAAGKDDLWFQLVSDAEKYLAPKNGALLKLYGASVPELADCKGASLSTNSIQFEVLSEGDWICYKTNEGRFGRFEIEGITAGPSQTLSIDLRTWN